MEYAYGVDNRPPLKPATRISSRGPCVKVSAHSLEGDGNLTERA